jgi:hypothetical protein
MAITNRSSEITPLEAEHIAHLSARFQQVVGTCFAPRDPARFAIKSRPTTSSEESDQIERTIIQPSHRSTRPRTHRQAQLSPRTSLIHPAKHRDKTFIPALSRSNAGFCRFYTHVMNRPGIAVKSPVDTL